MLLQLLKKNDRKQHHNCSGAGVDVDASVKALVASLAGVVAEAMTQAVAALFVAPVAGGA